MSAASNVNFDLLAEYNPLPETQEKPVKSQPKTATKTARTQKHVRKVAAQ